MNPTDTSQRTGAVLAALLLTIVTFTQVIAVPPAVAAANCARVA